ncbi:MAG: hypothetical protein PUG97_06585 [bacterium]|nr:hypothetical protein [bacterium]MDD7329401.1 hypothetical protein [bacterium]MDY2895784.1 hypothetical protein [Candidatus Enterosoma sp.]MDY5257373.1 hypothetical protein [Candidatus Enterosoma sp.]
MKKEISSKSKRKWVAGGLAAFASIALLTTGFATWVVGNTSLEGNGMVTVDVDTAVNKNIEFTATLSDAKIKLGETTSATGDDKDDKFVKTEGPVDGDLTISFSTLKIVYGRNSEFDPTTRKLKFSIENNKMVDVPVGDPFGRSGKLSYIEAPTEVPLSEAGVGRDERPGTGSYTYTFDRLSFSFRWGTFFGTEGKSPLEFYNSKFDADSSLKTSGNAQKVVDELTAMKTAFAELNNTIKLKLEIVAAA